MTRNYLTIKKKIKRVGRKPTVVVQEGIKPKGRPGPSGIPSQMTIGENIWSSLRTPHGVLQARLTIGPWEVNIFRARRAEQYVYAIHVTGTTRSMSIAAVVSDDGAWPVARVMNKFIGHLVGITFKAK